MATIDLGKVAFVWKGTYASGTTYESKDVVQYTDSGETSSYIYVNASSASGQTPSTSGTVNTTYWNKMAGGTSLAVGNNKIVTTDASGNVSSLALGTATQIMQVNSGGTALEFAEKPSGKVLQIKKATTSSLIQSSNNLGGKHFPSNRGVSNGAQIVSVSITPQSTTSHFHVWFSCASGAGNNAVSVVGLFCGSTLLNLGSTNNYASDVGGLSVHGVQDTTSLSGAQTVQARNLGCHDGSQHGVNAGGGGNTYNGGIATMTVMEIED